MYRTDIPIFRGQRVLITTTLFLVYLLRFQTDHSTSPSSGIANSVDSSTILYMLWLRVRIVPQHRDSAVENHSVCLFESDNHI